MLRDNLLNSNDSELLKQCRVETYRASGPGGQHRNTTDSAVRITITLNNEHISAYAISSRSQHQNKKEALKKLRLEIALSIRKENAEPWSDSWSIGKNDKRYPFFIAAILDAFSSAQWKISLAAKKLTVSTGKLNKILASNSNLMKKVNQERTKLNLKPLILSK